MPKIEGTLRAATAARLIREIEAGLYMPGSRLPFVSALAERYGVSTGTLSNALYDVQGAGYLAEKAGIAASWYVVAAQGVALSLPEALTRLRGILNEAQTIIDQILPAARQSTRPAPPAHDLRTSLTSVQNTISQEAGPLSAT